MLLPLLLSTLAAAEPSPIQQAFLNECKPDANVSVSLVGAATAVPGPCSISQEPTGTLVTIGEGKDTLYFMLEDLQSVLVTQVAKTRYIQVTLD